MKTANHPWYWPRATYFADTDPNLPGAQVMQHLQQNYCVREIATCPSITRAEKIAAALNRDEKRRKAKKVGAE